MKKIILMLLIFVLIGNVSALCTENQININTASAEELQGIIQIGPAYAEQIIALRPFNSLDDLTKVSGIAEKRLEAIKTQGLACVDSEGISDNNKTNQENYEEEIQENLDAENLENDTENSDNPENSKTSPDKNPVTLSTINLNKGKDIKINKNNDNTEQSPNNLAVYGLIGFCVLVVFLFAMKILQKKKYSKNEFTENE